jgi:hypothetical protein
LKKATTSQRNKPKETQRETARERKGKARKRKGASGGVWQRRDRANTPETLRPACLFALPRIEQKKLIVLYGQKRNNT